MRPWRPEKAQETERGLEGCVGGVGGEGVGGAQCRLAEGILGATSFGCLQRPQRRKVPFGESELRCRTTEWYVGQIRIIG